MRTQQFPTLALLLLAFSVLLSIPPLHAQATPQVTSKTDTVLHPSDLDATIPNSVFFSGQSATVQKRNSGGVRFAGGALFFVTKVDTGGYSSSIQEKYQAYLITETAVILAGHKLAPGAYGIGFIANNKFVVMDIGGHDLFTSDSQRDDALHRPTPLQVIPDTAGQGYRLYSGKTFVVFSRASETAGSGS